MISNFQIHPKGETVKQEKKLAFKAIFTLIKAEVKVNDYDFIETELCGSVARIG